MLEKPSCQEIANPSFWTEAGEIVGSHTFQEPAVGIPGIVKVVILKNKQNILGENKKEYETVSIPCKPGKVY